MTSRRQYHANRANAKASTGPRTAKSKKRIAQNALRHGLNVPLDSDVALVGEAEILACRIAGDAAGAALESARQIAEAQTDLRRVRAYKLNLLASRYDDLLSDTLEGPERLATILGELTLELAKLDRYERRAFSRRKFAIRAFDAEVSTGQSKLNELTTLR